MGVAFRTAPNQFTDGRTDGLWRARISTMKSGTLCLCWINFWCANYILCRCVQVFVINCANKTAHAHFLFCIHAVECGFIVVCSDFFFLRLESELTAAVHRQQHKIVLIKFLSESCCCCSWWWFVLRYGTIAKCWKPVTDWNAENVLI